MDNTLILVLVVTVSSYVIFGALFFHTVKSTSSSPEQRFYYLEKVVFTSAHSVEFNHPTEHPKQKRQRIEQAAYQVLAKSKLTTEDHFAIAHIIDDSMLSMDTNPSLRAIRYSNEQTTQITPPAGMMSLGIRHKAEQRTGKLV